MTDEDLRARAAIDIFLQLARDNPVGGYGRKTQTPEALGYRAWALARTFVGMKWIEAHHNEFIPGDQGQNYAALIFTRLEEERYR